MFEVPQRPGEEQALPPQGLPPQMLLAMGMAGQSGPTAEDQSAGIVDQLKQMMAGAISIAEGAPQTAPLMDQIRQLAMEAAMQVQQPQAGSQYQGM